MNNNPVASNTRKKARMARIVKQPEIRKQEILDAAMRLFYERGFERTSISDIAQALRISQGLCYRYFDSKESLLGEAVDSYAQQQVDRMVEAMNERDTTLKDLIENMDSFVGEQKSSDGFYYKLAHGEGGARMHDQLSLRISAKLVPIVRAQIERARVRGEVSIDDTDTVATFVVYGQLGILMRRDLTHEEKNRRIKAFLKRMLFTSK